MRLVSVVEFLFASPNKPKNENNVVSRVVSPVFVSGNARIFASYLLFCVIVLLSLRESKKSIGIIMRKAKKMTPCSCDQYPMMEQNKPL